MADLPPPAAAPEPAAAAEENDADEAALLEAAAPPGAIEAEAEALDAAAAPAPGDDDPEERERRAALERLRREQKGNRLACLMQQSELYAHFMTGDAAALAGPKGGAAGDSSRRGRKSEEAEDAEMLRNAMAGRTFTVIKQQPGLIEAGELRAYQMEGLNWLVRLHDSGINGILADEMGLGKTLQTISLLAYLKESRDVSGPHIVIVPKSTVGNWCREFARWCPSFRVVRLLGGKDERARILAEELQPGGFDVLVTSYEITIREKAHLRRVAWYYLAIDEAHRIKNENSILSQVVRTLKTQHRLLITGTPLQNNLHELWALLNFLLPDVFGSAEDFDSWFDLSENRDDVVRKLHTVLKPFLLRRLKADVEHSLPPKTETKLFIGLTPMQREWYQRLLRKDADALNALGGPDRVRLLNVLMQLRKVCNHPYLFEGAEPGPPFHNGPHLWENSGKMVLLDKLLRKLQAAGSRVLIFSQMTRLLDILEDYMMLRGYAYCRIDGSTDAELRDSQMDEFNAPDSPKFAFLLSTRAGGLGINLATADTVILYDSDWNPQLDLQAQDRAHRIGQKKPVRVFRFVTEGTVEEKIVERADRKLFLDAAVIQQGRLADKNKTLSKGELMNMVRFGADQIFAAKDAVALTDADIDALLAHGEERTAEIKARLQGDMQHSLANFSMTGDEASLYEFEGVDFRAGDDQDSSENLAAALSGPTGNLINLPQRERKRNYSVNEYFRDALRTGQAKKRDGPAKPRGFVMHDFQFFAKEELQAILDEENDIKGRRSEAQARLKVLKAIPADVAAASASGEGEGAGSGDAAPAPAAAAAEDNAEDPDEDDKPDPEAIRAEIAELEALVPTLVLPAEAAERKQQLIDESFGHWTRRDFRSLVGAMERFGREDMDAIKADMLATTGKPAEDVQKYYDTLWARSGEIEDWPKLEERIARGEARIARHAQVRKLIADKVGGEDDPWTRMHLRYGASRGKLFNEAEDRFLLCAVHEVGYGNWGELQRRVRGAWQFRFDWFVKSRTPQELQRRVDTLVRLIEREADPEGGGGGAGGEGGAKKRRKTSGGKKGGAAGGKKAAAAAGKKKGGGKRKRSGEDSPGKDSEGEGKEEPAGDNDAEMAEAEAEADGSDSEENGGAEDNGAAEEGNEGDEADEGDRKRARTEEEEE